MAIGRPLITRQSDAYPKDVRNSEVIGWVPPNDAQALASCVKSWISDAETLVGRGVATRSLYDRYFNREQILQALKKALDRVL